MPESLENLKPIQSNKDLNSNRNVALGIFIFVTLIILITLIISPSFPTKPSFQYSLGDIATQNIKAMTEFTVVDKEVTATRIKEALDSVLPVFDYDNADGSASIERLKAMLKFIRIQAELNTPSSAPTGKTDALGQTKTDAISNPSVSFQENLETPPDKKMLSLEQRYNLFKDNFTTHPLSLPQFKMLEDPKISLAMEAEATTILRTIFNRGIIDHPDHLLDEKIQRNGLIMRNVKSGNEFIISDLSQILTIDKAREYLKSFVNEIYPQDYEKRKLLFTLVEPFLKPNLSINKQETFNRQEKAKSMVSPSYYKVKKGEMIVREGERISEKHLEKLEAYAEVSTKDFYYSSFLGFLSFTVITLSLFFAYLYRFEGEIFQSWKRPVVLSSILVGNLLISRIFLVLVKALAETISIPPFNNETSYYYALPFCWGTMIVVLLFTPGISLAYSLSLSIYHGILFNWDIPVLLITIFGGIAATLSLQKVSQRSSLIKAGLLISLVNLSISVSFNFFHNLISWKSTFDGISAVVGGIITAMLASGFIPPIENIFRISTGLKYIEMMNLDQPLIKELSISAPGTYQHSITVGTLAEQAAKDIGADALLAKVASYFHDIGKIKKPSYFYENISGQKNKHDDLKPNISAAIIRSHVKDGIELAKKHKLSDKIVDIIAQHHGTGIIQYFYEKALNDPAVDHIIIEDEFRYSGPLPKTKEAAIVMMADAVEAAVRSINNHSPTSIREAVYSIIREKLEDKQFDDCNITFKELEIIANSFYKTLTTLYHQRIEYPPKTTESNSLT